MVYDTPGLVEREEVVVTLQGYVLRCNLPPITRLEQYVTSVCKNSKSAYSTLIRIPKNPITAKQSIVITGLGSVEFERSARAVLQIHTLFGSTVPEDTLLPWKPLRDSEYVCLEFSNRYFKGKDDGNSAVLPLPRNIDPYDMLRAKCHGAEHTEDNVVLYYERTTENSSG